MKKSVSWFMMLGFLLFNIITLNCGKDNPTESNTSQAKIALTPNDLHFSNVHLSDRIVISNQGKGTLSWNITSKPAWLNVSKSNGSIEDMPDTLTLSVMLVEADFGELAEKIIFSSNAGKAEGNILLSYQPQIEVFPGMGAARVVLGETYGKIKILYGVPDGYHYQMDLSDGRWIHDLSYREGLFFEFKTDSANISNDSQMRAMYVESPYFGVTEKLIGIGSSFDEITAAYGLPNENWTPSRFSRDLRYDDLGISFSLNGDMTRVTRMEIYHGNQ